MGERVRVQTSVPGEGHLSRYVPSPLRSTQPGHPLTNTTRENFKQLIPVASLGAGEGRTAPSDTLQGVTPEWNKKMWPNLKRTLDKRGRKVGDVKRRHLKMVTLQTAIKKVVSFFRKIGVTPSVAAPGNTNLSDVTGSLRSVYRSAHMLCSGN